MPYKTIDGQTLEYVAVQAGGMTQAIEAYLNGVEADGYKLVGVLPSYPVDNMGISTMMPPVLILHKD